ncbi:hypothetical protein [Sphingomonas sp. HMP6]|uniref:hypothetical protein n=1 Tax=Sphingomonas sp. HMP6 TaxID=1517551 RepID=UPI001597143F|nr:hypothetical protein [Sphingomonas sp. HMP6]BCA58135.1 hypothetical protein HMP06_0904 [Sphingomonas sp. HMP6]
MSIVIMLIVALAFVLIGSAIIIALARATDERKIYAFRMVGVMALALGVVLIISASAMWRWATTA